MAKPIAPKTSLGTLMLASLLPDLLAFGFLIAGVEHYSIQPGISGANALNLYDITLSHSLAMDAVWGFLLAAIYYLIKRSPRGAAVIFLVVLSHWGLDFLSHRPDMSLAPGLNLSGGLGEYDTSRARLLVEGLIWLAGIAVYVYTTTAEKRVGIFAFWSMAIVLTLLWATGQAGLPPPNAPPVEFANMIILAAVVGWAYWIDRMRVINKPPEFSIDRARF